MRSTELEAAARRDNPSGKVGPGRSGRAYSVRVNAARVLWGLVEASLFRLSFHNWYGWRRLLLRAFGAGVGPRVQVCRTAHIEMPWNLKLQGDVTIGDHAILYCLAPITIGAGTVVSQYAHLCSGSHDYTRRSFPLVCRPITIGRDAWIAADVFVGPGVTVGDRAVVGARSSVFRDLPADMICMGTPARPVRPRELRDD